MCIRDRAGTKPPILFLRISYNSILDKEFFDWLSKRVKESRLSGHHLVLEIKEDNAEEYFEEAKALRTRLREPVSYTHLDVYKRQALLLASARPGARCGPL